jgi:hypothetical protein
MSKRRAWLAPLVVIASLLFSQWAAASQFCLLAAGTSDPAAAEAKAPCPDMPDTSTCVRHCASGLPAIDVAHAPSVPAFVAAPALRLQLADVPTARARDTRAPLPPQPPPTIRFSVLRI